MVMTMRELIEKLEGAPQDRKVWFRDETELRRCLKEATEELIAMGVLVRGEDGRCRMAALSPEEIEARLAAAD